MRDWSNESCVKFLKNCWKAISEEIGKVIIVDVVLELENNGLFDDTGLGENGQIPFFGKLNIRLPSFWN